MQHLGFKDFLPMEVNYDADCMAKFFFNIIISFVCSVLLLFEE